MPLRYFTGATRPTARSIDDLRTRFVLDMKLDVDRAVIQKYQVQNWDRTKDMSRMGSSVI